MAKLRWQMAKLRWRLLAPTVVIVAMAGLALLTSGGEAGAPFVDEVINSTSSRIDYAVPTSRVPQVKLRAAISAASAFAGRPITVHSVRLGIYRNLQKSGVLVWVVDAAGLNFERPYGDLLEAGRPRSMITRAAILVSAVDGHVEALYSH